MKDYIVCPRCDQGSVGHYRVVSTRDEIWVCDECEAVWWSGQGVGVSPFADLSVVLDGMGFQVSWDQLRPLPAVYG